MEVITAWRADPADIGLFKSRSSDLVRVHQLGYNHDPGDFRELTPTYGSLDLATQDARTIKGLKPVDVLTTYLRIGYIRFDPGPKIRGRDDAAIELVRSIP